MKLRYKGKIKKIEHIIISDPTYDESVTCRYEKNNLNEENWFVDIDIKPTVEKIENFTIKGTEFFLFLYKDKRLSELKEHSGCHSSRNSIISSAFEFIPKATHAVSIPIFVSSSFIPFK